MPRRGHGRRRPLMTEPTLAHDRFVRDTTGRERNDQAPLGPSPSYDEVLDVAVEYTFPASDPVAVDAACKDIEARDSRH